MLDDHLVAELSQLLDRERGDGDPSFSWQRLFGGSDPHGAGRISEAAPRRATNARLRPEADYSRGVNE
jgi:hypothetical protein